MQSLLQGLPLAAQNYTYAQPSALSQILKGSTAALGVAQGILGEGGIGGLISGLFGGGNNNTSTPTNFAGL